jgi:hypothetical protein
LMESLCWNIPEVLERQCVDYLDRHRYSIETGQ